MLTPTQIDQIADSIDLASSQFITLFDKVTNRQLTARQLQELLRAPLNNCRNLEAFIDDLVEKPVHKVGFNKEPEHEINGEPIGV